MQSTKLLELKQFKAKKDQEYEVTVDVEKLFKMVQAENIKYKADKLNIDEKQFITLCRMGRNALLRQPSLLRLNGPLFIATGTVGYYKELMNIIARCGHPAMYNYLFLGDYIGRGDKNIQCLVYLICCKLRLMDNFFLIRGCLDSIAMSRSYNFYDECLDRFSPKAWAEACQFLCSLPFAAVVENQIFCCHGGISPSLRSVQQINKIPRPLETPETGLACDLVWADPSYKEDSLTWSKNERGLSYTFNKNAAEHFIRQNRLSLICRSHEVIYDGFYMNKQKTIAAICSLADYGGLYSNSAAVYVLNSQFQAFFKVIKQRQHFPIEANFTESSSSQLNKKIIEKKKQRKRLERQRLEQLQKQEERLKSEQAIQQMQIKEKEQSPQQLSKINEEEEEEIREKSSESQSEEQAKKMNILMGDRRYQIMSVQVMNQKQKSEGSDQDNDYEKL